MDGNTSSPKAPQAPFVFASAAPSYTFAIGTEPMIDMPQAAKVWEQWFGRRPHKNALRRLYTRPNRHGIVLPTILAGGRRKTSEAAIRWFVSACTAAANGRTGTTAGGGGALTPDERATLVRAGVLDPQEV